MLTIFAGTNGAARVQSANKCGNTLVIDNTLTHPIIIAESEHTRFKITIQDPPQWAMPVIQLFNA